MMTGYFGNEKRPFVRSKVHVVAVGGKPICGVRIGKDSRFHWCSGGINVSYVECNRCLAVIVRRKSNDLL